MSAGERGIGGGGGFKIQLSTQGDVLRHQFPLAVPKGPMADYQSEDLLILSHKMFKSEDVSISLRGGPNFRKSRHEVSGLIFPTLITNPGWCGATGLEKIDVGKPDAIVPEPDANIPQVSGDQTKKAKAEEPEPIDEEREIESHSIILRENGSPEANRSRNSKNNVQHLTQIWKWPCGLPAA